LQLAADLFAGTHFSPVLVAFPTSLGFLRNRKPVNRFAATIRCAADQSSVSHHAPTRPPGRL